MDYYLSSIPLRSIYSHIATNNALENVNIFLKVLYAFGLLSPPFPPSFITWNTLRFRSLSHPIAKIARALERHHDALPNRIQTHVSERIRSISNISLDSALYRIKRGESCREAKGSTVCVLGFKSLPFQIRLRFCIVFRVKQIRFEKG